jgi:methylphosphotriester-DNA--protein-cysteine methyltransferase
MSFPPFTQVAYQTLEENISDIATVQEWAQEMDYSRTHFSNKMKKEADIRPRKLLKRANKEKLIDMINDDSEIKAFTLAHAIGFSSIQSLYQYLNRHYDCSIKQFKEKVYKDSTN